MELDTRTIMLVGMATSLLISLLGFMMARGGRTCPGFRQWTSANLFASASLLLIGLAGIIPDALSILGGNLLAIASAALIFEGSRRLNGAAGHNWGIFGSGFLILAAICYFSNVATSAIGAPDPASPG